MRLIPVLDLQGGIAVHARYGHRQHYQPVRSRLAPAPDPLLLARAFRQQLGLAELYVADLDAIAGGAGHRELLRALTAEGSRVMVDAGSETRREIEGLLALGVERVVVGTETLTALDHLAGALARFPGRITTSLDLRQARCVSRAPELAGRPAEAVAGDLVELGAGEVLLLELSRVGSDGGPAELAAAEAALGAGRWLAGGGVRGEQDLESLARRGASGALVGTALHQGRLVPRPQARAEAS